MSDGGAPRDVGPDAASVAALVEAIDARARQAGQESAGTLLKGMLQSVSEVLTAIEGRLDHVEELLLERSSGDEGGGGAVASAVQEGLATFHARLGRLEEAFVRAVDDNDSGTQAMVDSVRDAVVVALASAPAPVPAVPEPVAVDLGPLVERLKTLEVAVSAPPPVLEPVDLGPVERRLAAVEQAVRAPVDLRPVVEQMAPLGARLAELEQLLRSRGNERVDAGASVRAALAPVVERLEALEVAIRSAGDEATDRSSRMETSVSAVPGRLSALDERLSAVVASLGAQPPGLDEAVVERLEAAVAHLQRDEAAARLVRMVEERMAAGMRAIAERADGVQRAVDGLAGSVGTDAARFEAIEAAVRSVAPAPPDVVARSVAEAVGGRLSSLGDRFAGLDAQLDGLDARLAGLDDNLAAVHRHLEPMAALQQSIGSTADALTEVGSRIDGLELRVGELGSLPATTATLAERVGDLLALLAQPTDTDVDVVAPITTALRAESELLTQRVAALAVGVEAARSLLEQHVDDTERSVGRKTTEIGRRIAADFGIRTAGRRGSGRRGRDPRELGAGDA